MVEAALRKERNEPRGGIGVGREFCSNHLKGLLAPQQIVPCLDAVMVIKVLVRHVQVSEQPVTVQVAQGGGQKPETLPVPTFKTRAD